MDLTTSGESDVLTHASECEFYGPADEFELTCEWRAESYGAALSRFNFLRVTLDTCLDAEFEARDNANASGSYRVLQTFSGSVESDDEDEDYTSIDIDLELVEYAPGGSAPQYSVELDFSR